MRISGCRIFRYRLPPAEPLTLAGRAVDERDGVPVRIDSDSGASGWGDVAPLPGFSRESLRDLGGATIPSGRDVARAGTSSGKFARKSPIPLQPPATIVHTSGSSGVPEAVLHSCGNHYYNAPGSNTNLSLTAEDRWLPDLPLHHVAGLGVLFRCLRGRRGGGDAGPGRGPRRLPRSVRGGRL